VGSATTASAEGYVRCIVGQNYDSAGTVIDLQKIADLEAER